MVSEQQDRLEMCFENSWYLDFSRRRNLDDDETCVKLKKKVNADGDDLGHFFVDFGDAASRYEVEVVDDFCRGISLEDVESGIGTDYRAPRVWLDDRDSGSDLEGSGDARQYENPLTARGLKRAWEKPR